MFKMGNLYTRDEIHQEVRGSVRSYLPTVGNIVVAGCFNRSTNTNPDAPDIVLPGHGKIIEKTAKQFTSQGNAVPIFIKQAVNEWQYVGLYKVQRQSFDKKDIQHHAEKANRLGTVSSVLFLIKQNH